MSSLIQKIKCNPAFPMIMAGLSYSLLTIVSAGCFYLYFTNVAGNDFWHWQLIGYMIMLANGISGFSEFFDEDSFYPLRDLLDYCQVALVLPCYAAQMWIKTEMGPPEIAIIHAGLGIAAAVLYIIVECKRQDLTDLALFSNGACLLFIAALTFNPFILVATAVLLAGYCVYKRQDDMCCMAPLDKFNFVMVVFALISIASFDDSVIQKFTNSIQGSDE